MWQTKTLPINSVVSLQKKLTFAKIVPKYWAAETQEAQRVVYYSQDQILVCNKNILNLIPG